MKRCYEWIKEPFTAITVIGTLKDLLKALKLNKKDRNKKTMINKGIGKQYNEVLL